MTLLSVVFWLAVVIAVTLAYHFISDAARKRRIRARRARIEARKRNDMMHWSY